MTQRIYAVPFKNVSIAAAQDIIGIYAGSAKALEIHEIRLGQTTNHDGGAAARDLAAASCHCHCRIRRRDANSRSTEQERHRCYLYGSYE